MEPLLELIKEAALEKKALEPMLLDLRGISGITDYFFICSGNTQVQIRAIADAITDKLEAADIPLPPKEGYRDGRWILLDCGSLVVHILNQQEREFYALVNLWHDAKVIPVQ